MTGAITENIDAVQLMVAAFFLFFIGLVFWLRHEDKREGYPLRDVSAMGRPVQGSGGGPLPKTYILLDGGTTEMPHRYGSSKVSAERRLRFPGAPLVPMGDPMLSEVGPGAYPLRSDAPLMAQGEPQVQPLRAAEGWAVAGGDTDPRGLPVFDARHDPVGVVEELWVDRAVKILRYLEIVLTRPEVAGRRVLLPIYYTYISRRRGWIRVRAILAHQFADVPLLAQTDIITAREEDRVNAYYANGYLFSRSAIPAPAAPLAALEPGE